MLANASAEFSGLDMFRMDRVNLKASAILENSRQAGVVRAGQTQDIKANLQRFDVWNHRRQTAEHPDMLFAHLLLDVSPIFPDNYVGKHL